MSKKKLINELEEKNRRLKDNVYSLSRQMIDKNAKIAELDIELERERKRYTELLERHITMMERMVKINEQREADYKV